MIDDAKLFFSRLTIAYPDNELTQKAEKKLRGSIKKHEETK